MSGEHVAGGEGEAERGGLRCWGPPQGELGEVSGGVDGGFGREGEKGGRGDEEGGRDAERKWGEVGLVVWRWGAGVEDNRWREGGRERDGGGNDWGDGRGRCTVGGMEMGIV